VFFVLLPLPLPAERPAELDELFALEPDVFALVVFFVDEGFLLDPLAELAFEDLAEVLRPDEELLPEVLRLEDDPPVVFFVDDLEPAEVVFDFEPPELFDFELPEVDFLPDELELLVADFLPDEVPLAEVLELVLPDLPPLPLGFELDLDADVERVVFPAGPPTVTCSAAVAAAPITAPPAAPANTSATTSFALS